MKSCPKCRRNYDDTMTFCLEDGTVLASPNEVKTAEFNQNNLPTSNNAPAIATNYSPFQGDRLTEQPTVVKQAPPRKANALLWVGIIFGALFLLCGGGGFGLYYYVKNLALNDPALNANNYKWNSNTDQQNRNAENSNRINGKSDADEITLEKFQQLETKMNYKKVVEIFGREGEQMSSSGSGNYKTEMYKWENSSGEYVIAMFMNDQLMNKTQFGLGGNVNPDLTLEKYNRIKDNMKYEEVVAILGEGDEISRTDVLGTSVVSYQWKGGNYSYIAASFQNGKLTSRSQSGLK